jgi:ABC-type sulfate transport system permease subunit
MAVTEKDRQIAVELCVGLPFGVLVSWLLLRFEFRDQAALSKTAGFATGYIVAALYAICLLYRRRQ